MVLWMTCPMIWNRINCNIQGMSKVSSIQVYKIDAFACTGISPILVNYKILLLFKMTFILFNLIKTFCHWPFFLVLRVYHMIFYSTLTKRVMIGFISTFYTVIMCYISGKRDQKIRERFWEGHRENGDRSSHQRSGPCGWEDQTQGWGYWGKPRAHQFGWK